MYEQVFLKEFYADRMTQGIKQIPQGFLFKQSWVKKGPQEVYKAENLATIPYQSQENWQLHVWPVHLFGWYIQHQTAQLSAKVDVGEDWLRQLETPY